MPPMRTPKISIVTPSFNQEEFIESTIQSVVHQRYPNLEYIVIDGGSSDNSVNIIKKYENMLSYWISEPDSGHGNGLNKGFNQASGEIMGWINSDDLLTPWSLNAIAEIFTCFPHINWIQGMNSWWNRRGQMINASRNTKNIYDYLLGNYAWIQQESVFWRRSLWDKAGSRINENLKYMVDGELWSRFFLHDNLYTVDCILSGYRSYGDNRASQNYSLCISEMEVTISNMLNNCSPEVINNFSNLKMLLQASTARPFSLKNALQDAISKKLIHTEAAKKLYLDTGYRIISWDIGKNQWVEGFLPFR